MNGKYLDRIYDLVKTKEMDTDAALRLMLQVQAETSEVIVGMQEEKNTAKEERKELTDSIEDIHKELQDLNKKLEKSVFGNPLVKIGTFIEENPKIAAFFFTLFVIVMNLWFVSGFRRAVLLFLHVPPEIVDAVAP